MMQSGNPVLTSDTFRNTARTYNLAETMTIQGTINKTGILLLLAVVAASWTWSLYFKSGNPAVLAPWMWGGAIVGFIVALVTVFKKEWSTYTAPLYAVCEGAFLGAISCLMEASYPGIVFQAVGLTFATLGVMLLAYSSGLIRATEKFKLGVVAATGAVAVFYVIAIVLSLFGIGIPLVFGNGIFGIIFSVVVVTIAALNLVIDFDFIEQGSKAGIPRYMEWYGAFALMVTLVWLYLEILRLLSKVRSR